MAHPIQPRHLINPCPRETALNTLCQFMYCGLTPKQMVVQLGRWHEMLMSNVLNEMRECDDWEVKEADSPQPTTRLCKQHSSRFPYSVGEYTLKS